MSLDGQVVDDAKYYLADVEAFYNMVVIVADIRGQQNNYFVLKLWEKWKEMFIDWLKDERDNKISDEEDHDEDDKALIQDVLDQNWDQNEDLVPENWDKTSSNEKEDD